jgi:serine/threonine-protein kinase HipA
MSRILDVYLHEIFAGQLIQDNSGALSFVYDAAYLEQSSPALSISMPLRAEPLGRQVAQAFFSGLLPDEIVRHRLAKYLGVSEKNPFSLLEAIGGECAGALSLYPKGGKPAPTSIDDIEVLDDQSLKEILDLLKRRPLLAGDDGLRLSLAGAQDKIAVGMVDGKIALVRGNSPTTHILKPVIDSIKDSVHNEVFCMRLASMIGLDVPKVEIRWLGDLPYFLVERYDRKRDAEGNIKRLHQEDFCQALGVMPELKYEREGGPNIVRCQDILDKYSVRPAVDNLKFLERIIFNYLIGNADAHGKNFSLLYVRGKPELAPAYDLLCTAVYEGLSTRMAMKIGKKSRPEEVFIRNWHRLVPDTVAARKNLDRQLTKMSNSCVEKSMELKDSLNSEGIKSSIFDDMCAVIISRAKRIKECVELSQS